MMPAECLLVFVSCIPWVTPGCNKGGGHRAKVVGQETSASTQPPLLWKVGSQAADPKSLLFLTHLSHLFCGGHQNATQLLHLLHPGLLTNASVRCMGGRRTFGNCQQTTGAEKQLQNCQESFGGNKRLQIVTLGLPSEMMTPFIFAIPQVCLALPVFPGHLLWLPSEPGCHCTALSLIVGITH